MFSESMIGVELGIAYRDIANCLKESESSPYEKRFSVLYLWKRQRGRGATNRALIAGLARCGSDRKLLELVSDAILRSQDPDGGSHDAPVVSPHSSLLNQVPPNLLMVVSVAVACQLSMLHCLRELLAERKQREEELAYLRSENARLHVVEQECDKLSQEVERLRCPESSEAEPVRGVHVPESGSDSHLKEPLGDRTVPGQSASLSSTESTLLGSSFTAGPPFSFTTNTGSLVIRETILPTPNVLQSEPEGLNLASQGNVIPEDDVFSRSLESEALTPDMDEDQGQMNNTFDDDDSKFSSSNTPSPKTSNHSQPESHLVTPWLNTSIEYVIRAGTRREHPTQLSEEAGWPSTPSPKQRKVASP